MLDIDIDYSNSNVDNSNPYPSIFEDGAFEIFKKWMDISNDNEYKNISFIIQKLKEENKLRNTNYKVLSKWANENGFLSNKYYEILNIEGCFVSPSHILTKNRLQLYNSILSNKM